MTDVITSEGNIVRPVFGKKVVTPPEKDVETIAPDEEKECSCRMVYVCSNCSCRSYNLFSDGSIACSHCQLFLAPGDVGSEYGGWSKLDKDPKEQAEFDPPPFDRHEFGDPTLARRMVVKRLLGWVDTGELQFITGFHKDGSATSWHNIDKEEDRGWILDRMLEAMDYVEGLLIGDQEDDTDSQLELEI